MTEDDVINKDKILSYLLKFNIISGFISTKFLSAQLIIEQSFVVAYCEEMNNNGYVNINKKLSNTDVQITDRGIHFIKNGGYQSEFEMAIQNYLIEEADKDDERKTRKVTRRTSIWSLVISILAVLVALFSVLAQIFGWL
jgi:predicted transcriptional regulator